MDGGRVLSESGLRAMRDPTVHMPGCALGDALGIGWILSDVGGAWLVGHDGSTNAQEASLSFLPEQDWALVLMTNASPGGLALNRIARRRVLAACTGIVEEDPRPELVAPETLGVYAGEYRARGMRCQVAVDQAGGLLFTLHNDPELLATMFENGEVPPSQPANLQAGLVAGHADRYVFADGPAQGLTGTFIRDGEARVRALHLFGRRLPRLGE